MSTLRTALFAGAAMLATVGSASADVYSVSRTFGPATTDFSVGPLAIAGFDTTRGTLTGVVVTLSSAATVSGSLTNNASGAQTFTLREETDVTTSSSVASLSGLTNALISSQPFTNLASGATAAYGPFSPTATASATPTSLAAFQGGTLSFSVSTLTGTTVLGGGGNIATAIATTASGTLAVQYTYTAAVIPPVGVPEPASMAILGAGLVGLGLVRRRK